MIRSLFGQAGLFLTALFLGATLVLPFNGGYVLAYALIILTLPLIVGLLAARARWTLGPAGWCFLAAFALIAIAFVLNGDAPMMVNFAFLIAFIPLSNWFSRYAAPDSAAVVSWAAFAGTVLSAVTALSDVYFYRAKRAEGWWSDPIWAAEAALILGFIAIMAVPVMKSRWRYVLLVAPVMGMGVTFLSGSRGVLLAVPVILLALLATTFRRWWKPIAAAFLVLVIAGAVVLPFAPGQVKRLERIVTVFEELFTTGSVEENSAGARIAFWKAGTQAFLDSPVIGYGWSRHKDVAYTYLPDGGKAYERRGNILKGNKHLHADILDIGVSAGLFGLVAYGLILLAPLLGALRSVRDSQYAARLTGAVVLTVGYAACGLTYIMFGYEFHTTLYVCLTAVVLGFCRDAPTTRATGAVSPAG
jgi:O-antigen ligase